MAQASKQRAEGPAGRPHRGSLRECRRQSEASGETAENGARHGYHGAGRPGGQETTQRATKELVATTAQGRQPVPNEGGPYHYFWVLRDVLVARRIQDHAAGVRVQAVDVEHAVLDVPPGPLQDLPAASRDKGGSGRYLNQADEENLSPGRVLLQPTPRRARTRLPPHCRPQSPRATGLLVLPPWPRGRRARQTAVQKPPPA